MRIAHVRERHAPAGTPWRLAGALDDGDAPTRWVDLEVARRRAIGRRPGAGARRRPLSPAADDARRPVSTGGLRVEALRELVEGFEPRERTTTRPSSTRRISRSGRPSFDRRRVRDFYAFEGHVRTMWERRGGEIPETWYRLPVFYFSNVSELRGPDDPVWCPAASQELDYELEVAALIDTPAHRPRARARRGGDRRLHDLRRLVGPRPPARGDGRPPRAGQGQGLRAARSGRSS